MKPPSHVNGTLVRASESEPLLAQGQHWITLVPEDESDERLWEWSRETGRIIQTRP